MLNAEDFRDLPNARIDGVWVFARPLRDSSIWGRIKDAWGVLMDKYTAVQFYKQ